MPQITDPAPAPVQADLDALKLALQDAIPEKRR